MLMSALDQVDDSPEDPEMAGGQTDPQIVVDDTPCLPSETEENMVSENAFLHSQGCIFYQPAKEPDTAGTSPPLGEVRACVHVGL